MVSGRRHDLVRRPRPDVGARGSPISRATCRCRRWRWRLPLAATLERLQSQAIASRVARAASSRPAARAASTARASILRHAWPVSLRPVLGLYGVMIGSLFSGSFVVEVVTAWPGLGRLMFDALRARDLFLVAGCAATGALFLAAGTLLADLLLAYADPRVQVRRARVTRRAGMFLAALTLFALRRAVACAVRRRRRVPRTSCTRRRCGRTSTACRRSCIRSCSPIASSSASSRIASRTVPLPWVGSVRTTRRCSCSAPTTSAATCCRGCCTARARRSASRSWPRSAPS